MYTAQAHPHSHRYIMPDPFDIVGVTIAIHDWKQQWLGMKQTNPHIPIDDIKRKTEETASTLRALSQTSRKLRALSHLVCGPSFSLSQSTS